MYFGLSCRQIAEFLQCHKEASYEAARQWYHRAKTLLRVPPPRSRCAIAIDEIKIKVNRPYYFLWTSIDADDWELLGI